MTMMISSPARARFVSALVMVVALLVEAGPSWACPACIGKNESLPPSLKLVGLFLLIPFALFGIAVVVVRRQSSQK